jgi:hypothetical protein
MEIRVGKINEFHGPERQGLKNQSPNSNLEIST